MNKNNIIGKGRFGKVIEIEDYKGDRIALKMIKPEDLSLVEIDILSRVKSPYLIKSVGELEDNASDNGIKLELKENNLTKLDSSSMPHGQIKRIIMTLIYGLECLHSSGFLHLDLKPTNCLYENKNGLYTGYISDFGFSLRCEDCYKGIKRKSRAGSLKYFPYEFLTSSKEYIFNDKSDVWSLGITILVFLGFKFSFSFSLEKSTEEKLLEVKKFWDNNSAQKLVERTLQNVELSELDKIDLEELLINMLQKDKNLRISSKDFKKLRFYNNNILENSCYVSKPKEILYIPYSSVNVLKGIENINFFFYNRYPNAKLEVYFLSIEIFIRLMAMSPLKISLQTLESHIQKSFLSAMKYYKEIKLDMKQLKIFKETGYDIAKYLKGDIAPNRYFYKAKYLEDLVLLREILLENYNLICLYSYIDTQKLFDYFRQNYQYKEILKEEVKTIKELMDYKIPFKNTTKAIENDRGIFSYENIKSRQEFYDENVSFINQIRGIEDNLIKELKQIFEIDLKNKHLGKIDDIYRFYINNFKEKNISIVDIFSRRDIVPKVNKLMEYGRIKEDIFDQLEKSENLEFKHIIFRSRNNVYSLLVRSNNGKEITHYFSQFNENLYNYFKINERNVIYKNNYNLGTSSICKINEICILFLIIYNNFTGNEDYNLIYLKDETLYTLLNIAYSIN